MIRPRLKPVAGAPRSSRVRARGLVAALAVGLLLVSAAGLFSGCESTQAKSARLEAAGVDAIKTRQGLDIGRENRDIEVVRKAVISDQNGTAVAVIMRNRSIEGLVDSPILVDVKGRGGGSVFRNDAPGLEQSLTHVPVMDAGEEVFWVHDQVVPGGPPKRVEVEVGQAKLRLPRELPKLSIEGQRIVNDPVSGPEATGRVVNNSGVDQQDLILYAIARRQGRIVAAGRGQVERLKADGKPKVFHIFFIGDPRGAELTVVAPPVDLGKGQ